MNQYVTGAVIKELREKNRMTQLQLRKGYYRIKGKMVKVYGKKYITGTQMVFQLQNVHGLPGYLPTIMPEASAKDANELFLQSFQDRRPLDESLVKEFQKCLTLNTYDTRRYQLGERPGEYKRHDYVTGKNEIGAAPEDVAEEMNELLNELHDIPADKLLTASAYYHVKFENIHPFADGNGRTGRLTMNYFLVINGHPPITIHQEDRKDYYDALEAWDERQELAPMESFLREQTIKTWEKQIERSKYSRYCHGA